MLPPKIVGVPGVDCSEDFSPKRGFEGDWPVAGFVVLNKFPPPNVGGGAGVPFVKIDGFALMVLFASGDVCIESSSPKVWPNGDFGGLPWPNKFIGAGLGAGLEALVPKIPPALVAGVAPAAGAVVAGAPNKPPPAPPEGRGCWAGLCPPAGGRLKMLPLNPENPLLSPVWLGPFEGILANGLLLL